MSLWTVRPSPPHMSYGRWRVAQCLRWIGSMLGRWSEWCYSIETGLGYCLYVARSSQPAPHTSSAQSVQTRGWMPRVCLFNSGSCWAAEVGGFSPMRQQWISVSLSPLARLNPPPPPRQASYFDPDVANPFPAAYNGRLPVNKNCWVNVALMQTVNQH